MNPPCPLCPPERKPRPVTRENAARMLVCDKCDDEVGDNEGDWR